MKLTLCHVRALAETIDSAKEPIYEQFKLEGLFQLISTLINLRIEELFEKKFITHFHSHYETNSSTVRKLCDAANQPHFMDLEAWINNDQNSITKFQTTLHKMELLCEEITDISYQTELFRKHIFDSLKAKIDTMPDKTDKEKEEIRKEYVRKLETLKLFRYNTELLGSFNIYQAVLLVI